MIARVMVMVIARVMVRTLRPLTSKRSKMPVPATVGLVLYFLLAA